MFVVPSPDERDAIQKKTFTKWVNKHLIKVCPLHLIYLPFLIPLSYLINLSVCPM